MPSAAILAGGRARRFGGVDKARLVVDGETILARQIAALAPIADEMLIVGGRGRMPDGCRAVPDRVADAGALGGLDAALDAAAHDPVIVLACDMPGVTEPFIVYLLAAYMRTAGLRRAHQGSTSHDGPGAATGVETVVPLTKRGYHPLCAVYARGCGAAVARRLAARRLSMNGLLEELRVQAIGEDDIARFGAPDRLLANLNTPADLDEIEALLGHKP